MTHAADPRPQAPRLPLAESPSSSPWRPTAPYKQTADHPAVPLTAEALGREARAWTPARP